MSGPLLRAGHNFIGNESHLIRNRNENKLGVCLALCVPLPEISIECRIKECVPDIAYPICRNGSVKTNGKQLFGDVAELHRALACHAHLYPCARRFQGAAPGTGD